MPDICDLVLDDHEIFRRRFAELDAGRQAPAKASATLWAPLAKLLELHAAAEEAVFYPSLLDVGGHGKDETEDAIADHNRIRDAVEASTDHEPGSPPWWRAVDRARAENSDHMAEEERGAIADLRAHAEPALRGQLGARWVAFKEQHQGLRGLTPQDRDPGAYIEHPG